MIAVQSCFCFRFPVKPRPSLRPTTPDPPGPGPLPCWLGGGSGPWWCWRPARGSAWRAVDGLGRVILEERLQEHAHGAEHAHEDEDPQEEPVDHHGDVLPVLAHLWNWGIGGWGRGGRAKTGIKVSRLAAALRRSFFICASAPPHARG